MTQKVAIVTDSTACVPQAMVEQYGIEIVPVVFIFGEESYLDGVDMTTSEFYERLKQSKKIPTTSGSQPGSYLTAYREASRRANTVLCITIPANLSGMYDSAVLAKEIAKETLQDVTIEVMDCATAAAGQGLVVLEAARMAMRGEELAQITGYVKDMMYRVGLLATLDTLDYLVKGGRVPKAAALASSLLQIKPIFTVRRGEAKPVKNSRTMQGALNQILKLMKKEVAPDASLHVAVMHADSLGNATMLAEEISRRFHCHELFITEFTPVMGVHTGPGVVGAAFFSES